MDYRVISIGSLSCHELWQERVESQTAHATTTLVRSGDRVILVDPGLPSQILVARLKERTGLNPSAITDVFLTNFRPAHRRGLEALDSARWYLSDTERLAIDEYLSQQLQRDLPIDTRVILEQEMAILKRCQVAPDRLAAQVDLFPLPGFSPGTCGLLLSHINATTLIAGDAVATEEHLEQGRVLKGCFDVQLGQDSFLEAIEIADVVVPGHGNLMLNPARRTA